MRAGATVVTHEAHDTSLADCPGRRIPDADYRLPRRQHGRGDSTLEHHATGWHARIAGDGTDSASLQRRECDVVWSGGILSTIGEDEHDYLHLAIGRRASLDQSGHLELEPRQFLLPGS